MSKKNCAPEGNRAAALVSNKQTQNTSSRSVCEAQIAFALSIEAERRRLVSELAAHFADAPTAATAFRHHLRELRLLGREVGAVAFGWGAR